MLSKITWLLLSQDYLVNVITRFLVLCYHKISWLMLLLGYCYHLVIVITWLLLSLGYCYHLVIVITWLLLSLGYCYHLVNIITLQKSLVLSFPYSSPKVITVSGFYSCYSFLVIMKLGLVRTFSKKIFKYMLQ